MSRPAAALALALLLGAIAAARPANAATPPTVSDFVGTWRIAAIVGASDGGVTGDDPKAMVGKLVHWTATDVRSPEGDCHLRNPVVVAMPNRTLETGIWGGQRIEALKLTRTDLARAFGPQQTPVFQTTTGCANAVLIDRNHMVDVFGSGWIYRLDRK